MASKSIFEKFDKEFDIKGLKEDLKNVASNEAEYKEVPFGTYEVKIEKMELVESKTGKPMLTCWMRILEGEYKNSIIFMNQVLSTAYGIHTANEFLRSLDSGIEVEFESFSQYNDLILDIHEAIDGNLEYAVE
ncbi:DUF669 domain-containing protein, partial [Caloramator proteoclasticus]